MNRLELISIGNDTMRITENLCKDSDYICCAKAQVYSPDMLQKIEADEDGYFDNNFFGVSDAKFYLANADSFEVASGLEEALVMNFANAHRPGGGFLNGARAQEESLCRCSTLYKSISGEKAKEMYDYNNLHKDPCDSDYMIISPNVYVFKDFRGNELEYPFWTSVVTVPAPDRARAAASVPQQTIDDVMMQRLRRMLLLAARMGYRDLVLGAWGCGAFGNDTRTVATYFYDLFFGPYRFCELFDNVVFAILGDEDKIDIFEEVFEDNIQRGYPDFFLDKMISDTDEPKAQEITGYYTSNYEYPVCNHTEGVSDENAGYIAGITADGVPFEAELYEIDGSVGLTVIIPRIYPKYETEEALQEKKDSSNITGIHYQDERVDYSVLDIGMVDNGMEDDNKIVQKYVDFLIKHNIVSFASEVINGAVEYRTDIMGNDLAKILITLCEDDKCWAYSDIDIKEFDGNSRKKQFKIIKN